MKMDGTLDKILCVHVLWMVLSWKCIVCQNANLTANSVKVAVGDSITMTCRYIGTGSEDAIIWLNGSNTDSFTLTAGSILPQCDVFATINASFDPFRLHHTCDAVGNNYTLTISPVIDKDFNVKWSCTFLDPSPNSVYSVITIQMIDTSTASISTTTASTTTPTTIVPVTSTSSSSTSMSSTTATIKPSSTTTTKATTNSTSVNPTTESVTHGTNNTSTSTNPATTGSATSASSSTSTSTSPTTLSTTSASSSTSTSTSPATAGSTTPINNNTSKSMQGGVDINVIVPAVVVPGGLLIIGVIILVVVLCKRRRRAEKNVRETPDGMADQARDSNVDGWKQSLEHGRTADKLDGVYTTPDGFIIYPGPAAMSTARPLKEKKYLDVAHQYRGPYTGTYGYQTAYVPNTHTSARAYTHKNKQHHDVGHHYSRPYTGTYGYQAAYVPNTYTSSRSYTHKNKNYDYEAPHQMAASRPAYDQTTNYPQTGYSGQIGQDVYYRGGGQYSNGQRSRSHHDHSDRQQQREYHNQYEMADYGDRRAGYGQKKQYRQDSAFYY